MTTPAIQVSHFVPGRIRLKLPRLKGDTVLAQDVQRLLTALPGIQGVEVSTLTGSVLVLYDVALPQTYTLEMLAPLFGLAETLGLSQETLPMEELHQWWHLTANGTKGLPAGALDSNLGAAWGSLSAGVGHLTDSLGDIRSLLPLTLLFLGIRSFLVTEKLPFPSWYDYLWFAFGTYMALQPKAVTSQNA
ncbi:MAG: HMA2 domain-containing protein [Candidatus Tectimicrobiota bacterium]